MVVNKEVPDDLQTLAVKNTLDLAFSNALTAGEVCLFLLVLLIFLPLEV